MKPDDSIGGSPTHCPERWDDRGLVGGPLTRALRGLAGVVKAFAQEIAIVAD
jgi:hypothetical protein